jgi:hypothetical protein
MAQVTLGEFGVKTPLKLTKTRRSVWDGSRGKQSRGRKRELPVWINGVTYSYGTSEYHQKHGYREGVRVSVRTKSSKSGRSWRGRKPVTDQTIERVKPRRRKL